MGQTDKYIAPVYKSIIDRYINPGSVVGMFGFTEKDKFAKFCKKMDFYDLRLSNWDINGDWKDGKTYKSIVCLRTSGFARYFADLLDSFYARLKKNGLLFIDWSLGSEHYQRDTKKITWGWATEDERGYGMYKGKKCFLYSSCLTDECVKSKSFWDLCRHASKWGHYRNVSRWQQQIRSEFMNHEIGSTKDIASRFDILYEQNWTPLDHNGRFQLYTIHVLRKV